MQDFGEGEEGFGVGVEAEVVQQKVEEEVDEVSVARLLHHLVLHPPPLPPVLLLLHLLLPPHPQMAKIHLTQKSTDSDLAHLLD